MFKDEKIFDLDSYNEYKNVNNRDFVSILRDVSNKRKSEIDKIKELQEKRYNDDLIKRQKDFEFNFLPSFFQMFREYAVYNAKSDGVNNIKLNDMLHSLTYEDKISGRDECRYSQTINEFFNIFKRYFEDYGFIVYMQTKDILIKWQR